MNEARQALSKSASVPGASDVYQHAHVRIHQTLHMINLVNIWSSDMQNVMFLTQFVLYGGQIKKKSFTSSVKLGIDPKGQYFKG